MTGVKSLEDLKRIHEEALEKRKVKATAGQAQVIIAMGRRSMTVEKQNGQDILAVVHQAVEHHGTSREELIPILIEVNRNLGYLPSQALGEISRLLRVPKSQLLSVASFYKMLSTTKRGKHVIQFCESAPCHVVGGNQVWQSLQDELQLLPNETSKDGKWTLVTTSCLGVCAVGPIIMIDDDLYGNVQPEQVSEILSHYS